MQKYLILANELLSSPIIKALCGPVHDLYHAYDEGYIKGHQPIRHFLYGTSILFAMIVGGIILPFFAPEFVNFETMILAFIGAKETESPKAEIANAYLGYLILGWGMKGTSYFICSSFYIYLYNDKDFFLTHSRLVRLSSESNISDNEIKEAFHKVRRQFHSTFSMPAAQKTDLKKVLESMMYNPPELAIETYNEHVKSCEAVRTVNNILPQYQLFLLQRRRALENRHDTDLPNPESGYQPITSAPT